MIDDRGENVMIIGDLNRALGNDKWGIIGNNRRVSNDGKFLKDLINGANFQKVKN